MNKGYVYVLENPGIPGLLKIGKTTREVDQRVKELSDATGVPFPFKVLDSYLFPDCHAAESLIHQRFESERTNPGREFFSVSQDDVDAFAKQILAEQIVDIIDEFAPNHTLVEPDLHIDSADIILLAGRVNAHPAEVAAAFHLMEPSEFQPAMERYFRRVAQRKAQRDAGETVTPFRCIDNG